MPRELWLCTDRLPPDPPLCCYGRTPCRVMECVPPGAVSVKVSVPLWVVVPLAVARTCTVHEPPGASTAPAQLLDGSAMVKPVPLTVTLFTVKPLLPHGQVLVRLDAPVPLSLH